MPGPSVLLLAALAIPGAVSRWHPQDGPHLDLEVRLGAEEVRLVAVLNLACADALAPVAREDEARLDPSEVEPLRRALLEAMLQEADVLLDGRRAELALQEFAWTPPDPERLPYYPRFGARATTTMRMELSAPVASRPRRLALRWGLYPPDLTLGDDPASAPPLRVPVRLLAGGTHQRSTLEASSPLAQLDVTEEDPLSTLLLSEPPVHPGGAQVVTWVGLGIASLALGRAMARRRRPSWPALTAGALLMASPTLTGVGRATLEEPEAQQVFEVLHASLYDAFSGASDTDIYRSLERSVEGPLLEELFQHLRRSLTHQEEGGARAEVEAVRMEEARITSRGPEGFDVDASWQVEGAVHHFGHFHRRTTAYAARFGVARGSQGWRIRTHEPLEERRLSSESNDPALSAEGQVW